MPGKVHASRQELRAAFRRHAQCAGWQVSGLPQDSYALLLIYAIECGLKAVLLQRRGVHNTSRLEGDELTHDLNALLRILNETPRFRDLVVDAPPETVPVPRVHEVFRYGRRPQSDARRELISALQHCCRWIEENF